MLRVRARAWRAQRLPERPFKGAGLDALKGSDGSCSICMCEYEEGEALTILPGCMHAFHKECIYSWLAVNRSCPLCRMDVTQASRAADV